ncbi:acyl-CoA dehydrogenase [Pelagibius litoralis]|uniref:3-sulfinopropanoyl-CoA desulfinase n=1 Tax=Pelagibius litoralis TaxID=374515 RepID=A0A967F2K9_9PROT|nr:3-sulfinopropanoyl-CoA desulfinase [Pelagibius litoralis]NIA71852.1 acyl-CoA dehydrogenase [Pelagibius litoralis]
MTRLTAEQESIQARARELAQAVVEPRAAEVDRQEAYPWDNCRALREAGFFGMTIPREYGGPGLGYLEVTLMIEEMSKVCGVTGRIAVEANMGAIGAIMAYGSEAQCKLAAAQVLSGDKPAICITEPGAGSAATEMTTRADRRGDRYVLNGGKHWITGGGVSSLHLIFARVFEDGVEQGIGGFIVVRDAASGEPRGLTIGRREPTMGLRGIPETEILFDDLEVPEDMLLRPEQGLRRGFGALMTAYNAQRVGAATVALGIAQGAYEQALGYTQAREQFGRPICEFQGLQWMLADMATQLAAARALIRQAVDCAGFPDALEAAQAKVFASEMAIKVSNDALQLFGAAGYSRNNPLERMVRDARMFTIGGGTVQILRTMIAGRILERKLPQTRDGYLNLARAGE